MNQFAVFLAIVTSLIVIWEFIVKKNLFLPFFRTRSTTKIAYCFKFILHPVLKKIHDRCIFATHSSICAVLFVMYVTSQVKKKSFYTNI